MLLSVIIPTRNRRELVLRCVGLLREQTQDPGSFEVIVVDDDSGDGSADAVEALDTPFELRVLRMDKACGSGAARNAGIEAARGDLCLFLDDDVIPNRLLLAEHVAGHADGEKAFAIGRMTQKPPPRRDWYAHEFANYFNRVFDELESKPPTWATAWTQNLSVARADLIEVGGFDAGLAKNFDIELAFRLWQSGLTARYLRGAHTVHDDGKGRAGLLADAKLHGTNYVALADCHPGMLPRLLGWFGEASPREQLLRRLLIALRVPAAPLAVIGPMLPGAGRRQIWFTFVARYAFWVSARKSMSREKWARITHGVPVLSYHAFGGRASRDRFVMPKRAFARQMRALRALGYRAISFEELVQGLRESRPPPHKSVVLTIDDGYRDIIQVAQPVLRRHGITATIFLVSGRIGGQNDWDAEGAVVGRALLTLDEIARLRSDGAQIGGHTRSHRSLPDATDAEIAAEVRGCREDLEKALGMPVHTFAYPFGRHDGRVAAAVEQAGFLGAGTSEPRRVRLDDDPLVVPRIEIRARDSLPKFVWKLWFGGP